MRSIYVLERKLIDRTRETIGRLDRQGLSSFALIEGTVGDAARAMGGAAIPLLANFTKIT